MLTSILGKKGGNRNLPSAKVPISSWRKLKSSGWSPVWYSYHRGVCVNSFCCSKCPKVVSARKLIIFILSLNTGGWGDYFILSIAKDFSLYVGKLLSGVDCIGAERLKVSPVSVKIDKTVYNSIKLNLPQKVIFPFPMAYSWSKLKLYYLLRMPNICQAAVWRLSIHSILPPYQKRCCHRSTTGSTAFGRMGWELLRKVFSGLSSCRYKSVKVIG